MNWLHQLLALVRRLLGRRRAAAAPAVAPVRLRRPRAGRARPLVRGFRLRMTVGGCRPAISRAMGWVRACELCGQLRELLAAVEQIRGRTAELTIVPDTLTFRRQWAAAALRLGEGGHEHLVAATFVETTLLCELWPPAESKPEAAA